MVAALASALVGSVYETVLIDGEDGGTAEIENAPGSLSSKGFEDPPSKKVLNDTLAVMLGLL